MHETIRAEYPKHFVAKEKIDGKSDLYTFFYLKSLRLLNPNGVHTFICSNSWLDVGYGAWMQKFLLNHCRVHFVIDNHARRSFASADVNTIISVIDAPVKAKKELDPSFGYKFVAFKRPFDEVLFTENLLQIEEQKTEILKTADYRSYPVSLEKLLEEGSDFENEQQRKLKAGEYMGDKWGGKYLRAPDIFFTILEKGKDKLVKLKEVANVKFGIKTGCNEFFYLSDEEWSHWKIEEEFRRRVIKSPRECRAIEILSSELKSNLFYCNTERNKLLNTNALKYITYGEGMELVVKQGSGKGEKVVGVQNIESVKGRRNWWAVGEREIPDGIIPCSFRQVFTVFKTKSTLADKRLYDLFLKKYGDSIIFQLNSIIFPFFLEILTRSYGGGGGPIDATVEEIESLFVIDEDLHFSSSARLKTSIDIFSECGLNPESSISLAEQEPNPLPDRKELDDVVFDALGLTDDERKEVYRAVCQLVWNRISKAKSV